MSLLKMSPSPHERASETTAKLMGKVLVALAPALVWACFVFGMRALAVTLVCVAAAVVTELLFCLAVKRPISVLDLSASVTGVLLAFNLPVSVPLWQAALGSVFAIAVAKMLFGGIGKNLVNPALAGRVFLLSSFTEEMTSFTADAVSGATPLVSLKTGALPSDSLFDMFIGNMGGCIGEVSSLLLLVGGLFLLVTKVITWHIPLSFIGTVAVFTFLLPHGAAAFSLDYTLAQLLSGGLMLGAIFMATDYVTAPITPKGKLLYGAGCGLITVFIRYFGGYPEGVSFAILIMNLLTWYIDKLTVPKVFGGGKCK